MMTARVAPSRRGGNEGDISDPDFVDPAGVLSIKEEVLRGAVSPAVTGARDVVLGLDCV